MKRIWILAALCCLSYVSAYALIVNVEGYGDVTTSDTLEITLTTATPDPMTGLPTMGISGSVLANGTLTARLTRSAAGLDDEFCCAGSCQTGNRETQQTFSYSIQGPQSWYTHYRPISGSNETVIYLFSDADSQCTVIVRYIYDPQGIEELHGTDLPCTKIIKDGILYIQKGNKQYTIL